LSSQKFAFRNVVVVIWLPMEILSVMNYAKKNLSVIVVILLTLLLIAMVIWVFDKKIETVEKQMNPTTSYHTQNSMIHF
jgi:hypothetical protein